MTTFPLSFSLSFPSPETPEASEECDGAEALGASEASGGFEVPDGFCGSLEACGVGVEFDSIAVVMGWAVTVVEEVAFEVVAGS